MTMIKFCKRCGEAVSYQIPTGDTLKRAVCTSCAFIEYENPKIITGILPVYQDRILLCKRAIEPAYDKWTIPSGFMELNETVEEGALREANEEAGIHARIQQLYCIYNLPHIGQVYFLYLATLDSPDLSPGPETSDAQFFAHHEIPWQEIAFSSVTFALTHYIRDAVSGIFHLRTGAFGDHD